MRTHTAGEKRTAWRKTGGFALISAVLVILLLFVGFPNDLWSPADVEYENAVPPVVDMDQPAPSELQPITPYSENSPLGEFLRAFLTVGLIASISMACVFGPAVYMEDSEVRDFASQYPQSPGPIINPISGLLILIAGWGLIVCVVLVVRYLYLIYMVS